MNNVKTDSVVLQNTIDSIYESEYQRQKKLIIDTAIKVYDDLISANLNPVYKLNC